MSQGTASPLFLGSCGPALQLLRKALGENSCCELEFHINHLRCLKELPGMCSPLCYYIKKHHYVRIKKQSVDSSRERVMGKNVDV